jgi:flagellar motor protein MotB
MKSNLFCAAVLVVFSVSLVSCVPYQTHDELSTEYQRLSKAHEDLSTKYNRLVQGMDRGDGSASVGQIQLLEDELNLKKRLIADLEKRLENIPGPQFVMDDLKDIPDAEIGTEGQLILKEGILFNSGSDQLKNQGRSSLDAIASLLSSKYQGETIHIIGHTDNQPIVKARPTEFNVNLGFKRAYQVFKFLNKKHGIPEDQFVITSFGFTKPKVPNNDLYGRAQNRRVEIYRKGSKF